MKHTIVNPYSLQDKDGTIDFVKSVHVHETTAEALAAIEAYQPVAVPPFDKNLTANQADALVTVMVATAELAHTERDPATKIFHVVMVRTLQLAALREGIPGVEKVLALYGRNYRPVYKDLIDFSEVNDIEIGLALHYGYRLTYDGWRVTVQKVLEAFGGKMGPIIFQRSKVEDANEPAGSGPDVGREVP